MRIAYAAILVATFSVHLDFIQYYSGFSFH